MYGKFKILPGTIILKNCENNFGYVVYGADHGRPFPTSRKWSELSELVGLVGSGRKRSEILVGNGRKGRKRSALGAGGDLCMAKTRFKTPGRFL